MFNFNNDTLKWDGTKDELNLDYFNEYKQDLSELRLYSKSLNGSIYLPVNNLDSIYDILDTKNNFEWYINTSSSTYSQADSPVSGHGKLISGTALGTSGYDFYNKWINEYGQTLKGLFTPDKLIEDTYDRYVYVDVATTEDIDLTKTYKELIIDGIRIVEGHRILVKDKKTFVTLSNMVDPDVYFTHKYHISSSDTNDTKYYYYNELNGIYKFTNGLLVRENDLSTYEDTIRYNVAVKSGTINFDKQFKIERLNNGYYPLTLQNEPIEFVETKNWILRNKVEYNNVLDLNLYDTFKHSAYTFSLSGFTYSIDERIITVGEFGSIINTFKGQSTLINNDYKYDLKSVTQTNTHYWVCGESGTLLRIDKLTFQIDKIDIGIDTKLNSVSFFNDLRGFVVGDFNVILYTEDSGMNWNRINIEELYTYMYNKVVFYDLNTVYLVGNLGVFIELTYTNGNWELYDRSLSRIDRYEEYMEIIDDVRDIIIADIQNWNIKLSYTNDSISINGKVPFLLTSNRVIAYIKNKVTGYTDSDFIFLESYKMPTDMRSIAHRSGGLTFSVASDKIYTFNLGDFDKIGIKNKKSNVIYYKYKYVVNGTYLTLGNISSPVINNYYSTFNNVYLYDGSSYITQSVPTPTTEYYIYDSKFNLTYKYSGTTSSGTFSSVLENTLTLSTLTASYANKIYDYNGQTLYYAGNNTLLKGLTYSTGTTYDLDTTYQSRYRPKFLFLDYDIASKVNFFDDNGNYRLPVPSGSGLSVPTSLTTVGHYIQISSNPGETSWLDYYRDSLKTYEYYNTYGITETSRVSFSVRFKLNKFKIGSITHQTSLTFSCMEVLKDGEDMKYLAPSIYYDVDKFLYSPTYSIDVDMATSSISSYGVGTNGMGTLSMYLYNGIGVFKILNYNQVLDDNTFNGLMDKGDVLNIKTSTIDTNVILNKKITNTDTDFTYFWFYHNFDEAVMTELKNTVGDILISNLNYYSSITNLCTNFNKHYLGIGYQCVDATHASIKVNPLFNNKTAYYNMACKLNNSFLPTPGVLTYKYLDSFMKFGYTPTYNIYDYLYNIYSYLGTYSNPMTFKEFKCMPKYYGFSVGPLSSTNVTFDQGIETNKIYFGKDLFFEWQSIFKNTFLDLVMYSGVNTYITERILVIDKYQEGDSYVILLHKKPNYPQSSPIIDKIDILSRRKLSEVSSDLNELNNIQRNLKTKEYSPTFLLKNYESDVNWRISTDSYAKILLSDYHIKDKLSAILYTDDENRLAINLIQSTRKANISIANTANSGGKLTLYLNYSGVLSEILSPGDYVVLNFFGGVNSSEYLNPKYKGFQIIDSVDDGLVSVTLKEDYGTPIYVQDIGNLTYYDSDYFFDWRPSDLYHVGVDKDVNAPIVLKDHNVLLANDKTMLIDIDYNNFKFKLYDNLDLKQISMKWPWLLEAEMENAIIGQDSEGIIWYDGKWVSGRWFSGKWYSGRWFSGDWYDGKWFAYKSTPKGLIVEVDKQNVDEFNSIWYQGRWYNGSWDYGIWYNGRMYNVEWKDGFWLNGVWNDGHWDNGNFLGGIWVDGTWENGVFSSKSKPVYWIDGEWHGGDFENGIWYGGTWMEKSGRKSRFGTMASNAKNAKWYSGNWSSGEFYSFRDEDSNGNSLPSEKHNYSIWYQGRWDKGTWYGGVAYNIDYNGGDWYGGYVEELPVISIKTGTNASSNYITLPGTLYAESGKLYLLDDQLGNTYSVFGSNNNVGVYDILDCVRSVVNGIDVTNIYISKSGEQTLHDIYGATISHSLVINGSGRTGFTSVSSIGLKSVSKFKNVQYLNGVWTNGYFESGNYYGGIWYNGTFKGNWKTTN